MGSATFFAASLSRMRPLGFAARGDFLQFLEEAVADHRDAAVAGAEIFLRAVGDHALPDPGDDVLVHHVA